MGPFSITHVDEPAVARPAPGAAAGGPRRRLPDSYTIAGVLVFVIIVVCCWRSFVLHEEELYFLGSRRLADPRFLALDLTWHRLPPTSALYDHLLAPLWSFLDEFTIANLGRFLTWGLFGWSLTLLARTVRLPAWSLVVGFAVWLLWRQNLATCGAPIEGFQVKSLSYPLMFFALTFLIRGRTAWAGAAVGLATAFHIIVGGWACLALFLCLLVNRRLYSWRQVAAFLLAAAPFVAPVVVSVALFHGAQASHAVQARIDQIYAMFAMPRCCDVTFFMSLVPGEWVRAAVIFVLAPIVVFAWPERRAALVLGTFITALIAFFIGGIVARRLELYSLLKLYPFQLANALPALFLFVFTAAWAGTRGGRAVSDGRCGGWPWPARCGSRTTTRWSPLRSRRRRSSWTSWAGWR